MTKSFKIFLIVIIVVAILSLAFFSIVWYFGRQIGGCRCMNLQRGHTQNINKTLDDLEKYCVERSLTNEEVLQNIKYYKNAENIKTIFIPKDSNTNEYISCNRTDNPIFRKEDNTIIGCYCGK